MSHWWFLYGLRIWLLSGRLGYDTVRFLVQSTKLSSILIIVAAQYPSRLTKLIGSQAVPLLAILFLLAIIVLYKVTAYCSVSPTILQYPNGSSSHMHCVVSRWKPIILSIPIHTPISGWSCYTAVSVVALHTLSPADINAMAAAPAFNPVLKMDYAPTSLVWCLLHSTQTQAPVLVWSTTAYLRNPTRDICAQLCHSPKH